MTSPNPTPLLSPHLFHLWVFPRISAFLSLCLLSLFDSEALLTSLLVSLTICTASPSAPLRFRLSLSVTRALSVPDSLGHAFNRHADTVHGPPPL